MTITEFLWARIGEDVAAASQRYLAVPPWGHPIDTMSDCDCGDHVADTYLIIDPARVLAECEAKRRVIKYSWGDHLSIEGEWGSGQSREEMDAKDDVPGAVRALAAIYADHPDYREEWRA